MLSVVMPVITHILQNSKKKLGKALADKKLKKLSSSNLSDRVTTNFVIYPTTFFKQHLPYLQRFEHALIMLET